MVTKKLKVLSADLINRFDKAYNLQSQDFAKHINDLSSEGYIEIPNVKAMAQNLKKKILDGVASGNPFELTRIEFMILETYEGSLTLREYFSVSDE